MPRMARFCVEQATLAGLAAWVQHHLGDQARATNCMTEESAKLLKKLDYHCISTLVVLALVPYLFL